MGKQVAARLKKENLLYSKWGCSSVGRAPALQAGGQEFESLRLHYQRTKIISAEKCTLKTSYRMIR